MSTGKDCTDTELCTYHNLHCAYPDCAYGRAQKAQTAKTHEVAARIRAAEAAVVEKAVAYMAMVERQATESYTEYCIAHEALADAVTALHAARQGEG